jgi:hypothetical protein
MNNEKELVDNIAFYYAKSLDISRSFGGPSIYFHLKAIQFQKCDFMSEYHIEMIYAALASWGMHRMGDPSETKAKMVDFVSFYKSLIEKRMVFSELLNLKIDQLNKNDYCAAIDLLEESYMSLKVSISDSTLVANSKALCHILPDLVPPIDRQYTVRFFTQDNKAFFAKSGKYKAVNLPKDIKDQFLMYKDFCIRIKQIFDQCDKNLFQLSSTTFNTSYPKIMDNTIMAFVKSASKSITKIR